jgi:hypothetical protein
MLRVSFFTSRNFLSKTILPYDQQARTNVEKAYEKHRIIEIKKSKTSLWIYQKTTEGSYKQKK